MHACMHFVSLKGDMCCVLGVGGVFTLSIADECKSYNYSYIPSSPARAAISHLLLNVERVTVERAMTQAQEKAKNDGRMPIVYAIDPPKRLESNGRVGNDSGAGESEERRSHDHRICH